MKYIGALLPSAKKMCGRNQDTQVKKRNKIKTKAKPVEIKITLNNVNSRKKLYETRAKIEIDTS